MKQDSTRQPPARPGLQPALAELQPGQRVRLTQPQRESIAGGERQPQSAPAASKTNRAGS